MSHIAEIHPFLIRRLSWVVGHRFCRVHRTIAHEDSFPKKVVGFWVSGVNESAINETVPDALLIGWHQILNAHGLDNALDFLPGNKPELSRVDNPKQAVAPYGKSKEFSILLSAASVPFSISINQYKRLDILNEWLYSESLTMHVGAKAPAYRQPIS
jgi:hypothetical protein